MLISSEAIVILKCAAYLERLALWPVAALLRSSGVMSDILGDIE